MKAILGASFAAAITVFAGCDNFNGKSDNDVGMSVQLDADDIGGVVTSGNGPEAGVWVIAETDAFETFYAKIVVTDDAGRYVVPDLPDADYKLWVRGYGIVDSAPVMAKPGTHVDLAADVALDAASAAKVYPAAYWYAMLHLPKENEVANVAGGLNGYLMWTKNMGCVGCHQLGQLSTRTIEPSLGKFASSEEAWRRRLQSGQAGGNMVQIASGLLGGVPFKYLADWTDRIAAGETPATSPERPSGQERNVVATVRDWASAKSYLHDLSGTDRRDPTVNGYGSLYGSPELSSDDFPVLDPKTNTATTIHAPVRDADTPAENETPALMPSPYWGDEAIWDSKANIHNPMLDAEGRVWLTARVRSPSNSPAFCGTGSNNRSAKLFPNTRSGRQMALLDPKTGEYKFIDTCFSTHHLNFGYDADNTLWTSGGGAVVGWLDTKKFLETGNAEAAQGWAPIILDTNGNGKQDAWVEPDQPVDPKKDKRVPANFYAVMPSPVDGSVWGTAAFGYPGGVVRLVPGDNPPQTSLGEVYNVPLPGFGVRGGDIDSQGVIWVSLGSGHLGSFDRRKCKGPLNGPNATGNQCPEGWSFYRLPGPSFADRPDESVESSYYTWVDQHDTLGLGADVPIATGNLFDGVHALVAGKFVTIRIPYPLGFYMKGMEGRIDNRDAGWKGRGLWVTSGDRTPWLKEGGKGTRPLIVHFQVRPDPLAK
jgi:hypothetical protein